MSTVVRSLSGLLLAVFVLAGIAACSLLPPQLAPNNPAEAVVTLELSGGECPRGMCEWKAQIFRDGRVVRSDGQPQAVDGASLQRLVAQVDGADWTAILARPFTDTCPTAYDGQEETYTFATGGRSIVVASCTVVVDHDQEPFQTVQGILFGLGG
jgi:hypothetical protein